MELQVANILTYVVPVAIASLFTLYRNSIFCLWSCNPKVVSAMTVANEGINQVQRHVLVPLFRFVGVVLNKTETFHTWMKELISTDMNSLVSRATEYPVVYLESIKALVTQATEQSVMVLESMKALVAQATEHFGIVLQTVSALIVWVATLPTMVKEFFVLQTVRLVVRTNELYEKTADILVEFGTTLNETVEETIPIVLDTLSLIVFSLCTAIILYNFFKSMIRKQKQVDDFRDIGRPFTRSMKRKLASLDEF